MVECSPAPIKLDAYPFHEVIFHPRIEQRTPLPPQCVDVDIKLGHSITLGCRVHVADPHAPFIIFFHGNGETVADYDGIGQFFTDAGLSFACLTYRGYGWSSGEPKASVLFSDASCAFEAMLSWMLDKEIDGPVFLMGRSLGSVSAIELANCNPDRISGLIIESGFADTIPLLSSLGCSWPQNDLSEDDCFGNRRKIAMVSSPTLIIHGTHDELIPVAEAEKLQAESGAKNKQFQVVPRADHNTVMACAGRQYFFVIRHFIDGVTGANSWRERRRRFRKEQSDRDTT